MKYELEGKAPTQPQVISDGRSVWVNAPTGECIARFGFMGVDVHRTAADQMAGGRECLVCTHGPVTLAEWNLFQEAVLEYYCVTISEVHRPQFLPR